MKNAFTIATGTTSTVIDSGLPLDRAFSVNLASSDGTRKIEASNDGINYFSPTIDQTLANALVVAFIAPVKSIRVTGIAGDILTIV